MEGGISAHLRRWLERSREQLPTSRAPRPHSPLTRTVEEIVGGEVVETEQGACLVVDHVYPRGHRHGDIDILSALSCSGETIAAIGRDGGLKQLDLRGTAFLDVETTGLAGGVGTYAFLVGIGQFEGDDFRVRQVFMRDYSEEPALISKVEKTLAPLTGVVSFNGKAFDVPVLEARFIMSRRRFPLTSAPHFDLLAVARRIWRLRLESCSLSSLEQRILRLERDADVPGYLIPSLYFDYLRYGQAEPMAQVFRHNSQDILSLAALTALTSRVFEDPLHDAVQHGEDLYSLGRLYLDAGLGVRAENVLRAALDAGLPEGLRRDAFFHLSLHLKRQARWGEATDLWGRALQECSGDIHPFVELAKYYEHKVKDFEMAERLVLSAMERVQYRPRFDTNNLHRQRLAELTHRLDRIRRKKSRSQLVAPKVP